MRRTVVIGVAAVAFAGIAAIIVVGLRQGGQTMAAPPPADPVVVSVAVEPSRALAGDTIIADLALTIDTARVEPGSIDVGAFFRPFRQVGAAAVERTDLGQTEIVRYRYPLQCLDRACALGTAARTIDLPIGLIRYTPRDGDVVSVPLTWPSVTLQSRLSEQTRSDLRSSPTAIEAQQGDQAPELVPTARATAIGWGLLGVAALALLAIAALALRRLWGSRAPARADHEVPRTQPLAGALHFVDEAADDSQRRVALDALALRLEEAGETGLARDARRLAWSGPGPIAPEVSALREAVARLGEEAA